MRKCPIFVDINGRIVHSAIFGDQSSRGWSRWIELATFSPELKNVFVGNVRETMPTKLRSSKSCC